MANSQDERGPMPQVFRSVGGTGPPRKVLAYGDSLTAGFYHFGRRFAPYGAALAEALGQTGVAVEVWVCGLSGLTVADFVRDIQQDSVTCVCGRTGEVWRTFSTHEVRLTSFSSWGAPMIWQTPRSLRSASLPTCRNSTPLVTISAPAPWSCPCLRMQMWCNRAPSQKLMSNDGSL